MWVNTYQVPGRWLPLLRHPAPSENSKIENLSTNLKSCSFDEKQRDANRAFCIPGTWYAKEKRYEYEYNTSYTESNPHLKIGRSPLFLFFVFEFRTLSAVLLGNSNRNEQSTQPSAAGVTPVIPVGSSWGHTGDTGRFIRLVCRFYCCAARLPEHQLST